VTVDVKELRRLLGYVLHREVGGETRDLPWELATSNSFRRVVDAGVSPVVSPVVHRDGHPDITGSDALGLMVAAVNALPELLDAYEERDRLREKLRVAVEALEDIRNDAADRFTALTERLRSKAQTALARIKEGGE
jgi:hypothetical protein